MTRTLLVAGAVSFALYGAYHARVNGWLQRYLWTLLLAPLCGEVAYAASGASSTMYEVIFTLALNVILVTAGCLVWQWSRLVPARIRRWAFGLSLAYAAIVLNSLFAAARGAFGYLPSQTATLGLAGVALVAYGVIMLSGAAVLESWRARVAGILGTMWTVQAVLYLLFAYAQVHSPTWSMWEQAGQVVFPVVMIFGMVALGFTLLLERGLAHLALTESR